MHILVINERHKSLTDVCYSGSEAVQMDTAAVCQFFIDAGSLLCYNCGRGL